MKNSALLLLSIFTFSFCTEVTAQVTKRISLNSAGAPADRPCSWPVISGDGRYVAFASNATNLFPQSGPYATTAEDDVFFRDLQTGTTIRLSTALNGNVTGYSSARPSISADGRYVVFDSDAPNLVTGDTNSYGDVFLFDTISGTRQRVNLTNSGGQGSVDPTANGTISPNGRYVAFSSRASNLVTGDTNKQFDAFVRDLVNQTTTRISVDSSGNQSTHAPNSEGNYSTFAFSADGRYVAFTSEAINLVPGDTNGARDVFVRDMQAGTTTRVSVANDGSQGVVPAGTISGIAVGDQPSISADGRYIAFTSYASNLVSGDTNGDADVFIRDMVAGTTTLASKNSQGIQLPAASYQGSLSADGNYLGFVSPGNFEGKEVDLTEPDVFQKNLVTGVVRRVSIAQSGVDTLHSGGKPSLSSDGRFVAFTAESPILPGGGHLGSDIFLFDRNQLTTAPAVTISASLKTSTKKLACTVKLAGKVQPNKKVTGQTSATETGNYSSFGSGKTNSKGVVEISYSTSKVKKGNFVRCSYSGAFSAAKKTPKK